VARLIGAPPGYIGFDAGSTFSRVMQSGSDKVILLDEVEKAHPRSCSCSCRSSTKG